MELCDSDVKYDRFCNVLCSEEIFLCWMWKNSKSRVKNEALTTTVTVAYCLWCMLRILLVNCLCKKKKKKVPKNIPAEPVTCKYTKISQSRCHETETESYPSTLQNFTQLQQSHGHFKPLFTLVLPVYAPNTGLLWFTFYQQCEVALWYANAKASS